MRLTAELQEEKGGGPVGQKQKKGIIAEFKEFIARGNVLDMAVGIIVGSAFTSIVNSLVNDILMPAVGYVIGGVDFSRFQIPLPMSAGEDAGSFILYGNFIAQIIIFLITALAVFFLLKGVNLFRRKKEEAEPETPPEPERPSPELETLMEIRDLLKKQGGAQDDYEK